MWFVLQFDVLLLLLPSADDERSHRGGAGVLRSSPSGPTGRKNQKEIEHQPPTLLHRLATRRSGHDSPPRVQNGVHRVSVTSNTSV